MKKYSFGLLLITLLIAGCGSPEPKETFATRARAQGAQYNKIAQDWDKGNNLISTGKARVEKGKEQLSQGRDLVESGEDNIENGREMINEGQNLKSQSEAYIKK